MNVAIIGNSQKRAEKIKAIAAVLNDSEINVQYPSFDEPDPVGDVEIREIFARIDRADLVLAIPREGLSFEHSTMSEIAYAKHVKKPVFVYYE